MEKIVLENWHKIVKFKVLFKWVLLTKEDADRISIYNYNDDLENSQYIASCTKQDMLDAVEFLFAE